MTMAPRYKFQVNGVTYACITLGKAVKTIYDSVGFIPETRYFESCFNVYDTKTGGYVYKQKNNNALESLSDKSSNSTSKEDLYIYQDYLKERARIMRENPRMTLSTFLRKAKVKDTKQFKYYVLSRKRKPHNAHNEHSFFQWWAKRTNKTNRGIRLAYCHKVSNLQKASAHISTVFKGVLTQDETSHFETLVCLPHVGLYHVWRYDNHKDALEGHVALKNMDITTIEQTIELDQMEFENVG